MSGVEEGCHLFHDKNNLYLTIVCFTEFRSQLIKLEEAVSHVPGLLLKDLLDDELSKSKDARDTVSKQFAITLNDLQEKQV